MQKQENQKEAKLLEALRPIITCQLTFKEQKMLLHEMFATSVANAPSNEVENYTANRLKDFYLALCETFENISLIEDISTDNILFSMDRFAKPIK